MATTRHLEYSRTFPVPVEEAFDRVLVSPLPYVFGRRYGLLPPIREVHDQVGEWGTVGQTRMILLADGGSLREELTHVERPHRFGYRIDEVTGPMKLLASGLAGRWSFTPAGTGVRITWAWELQPASAAADLAMPAFARVWRGYARQGMEEIERLLVR